jgi:hypothetical protein
MIGWTCLEYLVGMDKGIADGKTKVEFYDERVGFYGD